MWFTRHCAGIDTIFKETTVYLPLLNSRFPGEDGAHWAHLAMGPLGRLGGIDTIFKEATIYLPLLSSRFPGEDGHTSCTLLIVVVVVP